MTTPTDFLGAKASNAGDEFHEIWALQSALDLISPKTELTAVTLEGVACEGGNTKQGREWDGVDCGLYFGGEDNKSANYIELIQLKYSSSQPNSNWTPSRFCKSTSQARDNSVARRLGDAFKQATKGLKAADILNKIKIVLVTNQPIGPKLTKIVQDGSAGNTTSDTQLFTEATGLTNAKFKLFCNCLDLRGGEEARCTLKADVIKKIASFTDSEVSSTLNDLRQTVRGFMLPEGNRAVITKGTVLTWFKVADLAAIFPCPQEMEFIQSPINRAFQKELLTAVKNHPLVCLYGGGGCGKSTTSSSLIHQLPQGSIGIVFDCYGAGSYLDPSKPRHRRTEAFTQLANEVALAAEIPFLFPHQELMNVVAAFRRRLVLASEVLHARDPKALLVIIIDAADNSVFAATQRMPNDPSFVLDVIQLTKLPENVRFVITTRDSRKDSLELPSTCFEVNCPPFSLEEVSSYITTRWQSATQDDIEQFHLLSGGNPRVLGVVCSHCEKIEEAIDLLRPNGKSLPDLFAEVVQGACTKVGAEKIIETFCAAASVLPTPTPVSILSSLCEQSNELTEEICSDLSPNTRVTKYGFEFANEDFEQYVRERGAILKPSMREKAADILFAQRHSSDYAATHLFDILSQVQRHKDIFSILEEQDSTKAITDEIVRRRVDLRRLQTAITVAANEQDPVQVAKTILIGAESIRTENKVFSLVSENLALASEFAEQTIRHEILRSPDQRAKHGPALFHLAKAAAQESSMLPLAREYIRIAKSWVDEYFEEKKANYDWNLDDQEIVAWAYTIFRDKGWRHALDFCFSWKPSNLPYALVLALMDLVLKSHGLKEIHRLAETLPLKLRWMTTCILVRAGEEIAPDTLSAQATALQESALPELPLQRPYYGTNNWSVPTIDTLLFFTEACLNQSLPTEQVTNLVEKIWPKARRTSSRPYSASSIECDFTLRAESICSHLNGQELSMHSAFGIPSNYQEDGDKYARKSIRRFLDCVEALKGLYITATASISDTIEAKLQHFEDAVYAIEREAWRNHNSHEFHELRTRACRRIVDVGCFAKWPVNKSIELLTEASPAKGSNLHQSHSECFSLLLCSAANLNGVVSELDKAKTEALSGGAKASERAQVLIDAANLICPLSSPDAKVLFEQALAIIEGIDLEAIDQLIFLCKAAKSLPNNTRESRQAASKLALNFEYIIHILDGEELPERRIIDSLTWLSSPIAMAVLSQWMDIGLIGTSYALSEFLKNALRYNTLDGTAATALSFIIEGNGLELLPEILESSTTLKKTEKEAVLDELSRRVLLEPEGTTICQQARQLMTFADEFSLASGNFKRLAEKVDFLQKNAEIIGSCDEKDNVSGVSSELETDDSGNNALPSIDPTDASAIREFFHKLPKEERFSEAIKLKQISNLVNFGDRTKHLDALVELANSEALYHDYLKALQQRLIDWKSPAVDSWKAECLPLVMVSLGEKLVRYGWYEPTFLRPFLDATGLSNPAKVDLIIKIACQNGEELGTLQLYQLVVTLTEHLPEHQSIDLYHWYLDRLNASLSGKGADLPSVNMICPEEAPDSVAVALPLFIYRSLGDVDARVRWRTAHALRTTLKLGNTECVQAVLNYSSIGSTFSFCQNDVPFHYLDARLWLAMTLVRIAAENPIFISENAQEIVALVADAPEPHILISHLIKRCLLTAAQRANLPEAIINQAKVMCEPIAGTVTLKDSDYERHGLGSNSSIDHCRFRFDRMDTLPYWYNSAIQVFADLSGEQFLERADHWICDVIGGCDDTHLWEREPRKTRIRVRNYDLTSHRHGDYPTIIRHSRYLEWHAMFIVIEELLETRKLANWEDHHNTLGNWLKKWSPSHTSLWLSDLREPKPNDTRYWLPLVYEDETWFEGVDDDIFIGELRDPTLPDGIILKSSRFCKYRKYGDELAAETVQISTAFVPTKTARALLCVLQNIDDPTGWYLSEENEYDQIDEGYVDQFSQYPSVQRFSKDYGFDRDDPLHSDIGDIRWCPSTMLRSQLGITGETTPCYVGKNISSANFPVAYVSWSDLSDRTPDIEMRGKDGQFSSGTILSVDRTKLLEAMSQWNFDLIIRVNFKRTRGKEYGEHDKEDFKKSIFEKIFLLRQDGRLEDADGYIEAWS